MDVTIMDATVIIPPQCLLAAGVIIPPGATSFEIDARPHFISDGHDQHPVSLSHGDALLCHGAILYLIPDTSPVSMIAIGDRVHTQNAAASVLENCLTDVFYGIRFMDAAGAVITDGKMSALAFFYLTNAVKIRPDRRHLLENVKDFHVQSFGQFSWHGYTPEALGLPRITRPVFSEPYVVAPPSAMQSPYIGNHLAIKPFVQHYENLIDFLTDAAMSYAELSSPTILSVNLHKGAVLPAGASLEYGDAKQSVKSVRPFVKAAIQFAIAMNAITISAERLLLIYNPVLCVDPEAAKSPLPYPSSISCESHFMHALHCSGIPFPKDLIASLTQGFRASLRI